MCLIKMALVENRITKALIRFQDAQRTFILIAATVYLSKY